MSASGTAGSPGRPAPRGGRRAAGRAASDASAHAAGLPFDELADREARDRIASALDRNVLVEAGAGSGKTYEMARRMAAGIAQGVYTVDGMAAVTFTRKAAAELRGRFQLALEDLLARTGRGALYAGAEARVREALSGLERFFAGTIHAFCAHLLRERPVEAGVSPGFAEIDDVEDAGLRRQCWRDYVSLRVAAGDPLMLELRDAGVKPSDLDEAFRVVTLYEEVDFPPGDGDKPEVGDTWRAIEEFWTALQAILPARIAGDTTCPTQKRARELAQRWRVARALPNPQAALAELLQAWDCEPKIVQKWWADDAAAKRRIAAEVTGLHGAFRAAVVRPFLDRWRRYIYRLAMTLLTDARAFAAEERARLNVLNYGDLLLRAARMLREKPAVREALQQKYRWIFVDEFQDTDPVQAEIIFLLASASGAAGGSPDAAPPDWRSLPLRPGALFVVGDPKQSIYRFRRADIDIYNLVRSRLDDPPRSEVLELTTNFRSVPALCKWANTVFARQFPPEATIHSPKFSALDPAPRTDGTPAHPDCGVFTLTIAGTSNAREVREQEAERIARYIRHEVDAGRRAFGDFLVLTRRKKANLSTYAAAFERLHIPIEVSGAGAFRESAEVAQLALLLRALADPQDTVSLVGVLRGPLFGVSDPELFAWRQQGGWLSILGGPEDGGGGDSPVGRALAALRQYFRWIRFLPAAPAIERILEHSGYLALAATSPGGVEAGDLLHAIDRVRQVVADGQTLADAADALEDDLLESSEVESLPLEPGRTDVVRLMNLHKAKGLEAAVVFLADPCGGYPPRADVRIVRDGTAARGYFPIECRFGRGTRVVGAPADWDRLEQGELAYLEAEERRLLYVAATRARETLVIGRAAAGGRQDSRAWGPLEAFLGAAPELRVPEAVAAPAASAVDMSEAARIAAEGVRLAAHRRVLAKPWSVTSVTAEARHIAALARAAEPAAPDDPTRVVVRDTPSHRADAGIAWGTLVHGLLEHAMRHEHATREDLRRLALWLTVEEPQLRPAIDEAIDTVLAVTAAGFWREAQGAEHSEETPFAFVERPGVVMTGIVDLIYRTAGGWQVVDYKTDIAPDEARSQAYSEQLEAYRRALEACGLRNVSSRLIPVRGW